MHKSLPNTTRQAGKRYCQNDKVRITQRQEHTDHVSNVQGKVLCSFGFVHHPRLRAVLLGDQTVTSLWAAFLLLLLHRPRRKHPTQPTTAALSWRKRRKPNPSHRRGTPPL